MKLTDAIIRRELPPTGKRELRDDACPGLMLRGNKEVASWAIRFTEPDGRRRRHTLGKYPTVNLAAARKAAGVIFAQMALGERLKSKTLQPSLREAVERYGASIKHLSRPEETLAQFRREYDKLLDRDLRGISKGEFLAVADKIRRTRPAAADGLLRCTKPFLRWAADREMCDHVLADVRVAPTVARDRYLSLVEAKAVYNAAKEMRYPFGPVVRVLMLTGSRKNEVAQMRKDELDLDGGLWTLPGSRTKNGLPWSVPLVPLVVEILRTAQDLSLSDEFVFSTTGKSAVSGFSKAKIKLDQMSGINDWRYHDFRRTIVTALADEGYDPASVDSLLNHSASATRSGVSRIYNKSALLGVRKEMSLVWAGLLAND